MKLNFRLDFTEGVEEHAKFLGEEGGFELAERFMESVRETCRRISKSPMVGFTRDFRDEELAELRIWRVKGFEKYLIFYIPKRDEIEFFYFLHSARDYTRFFEEE